MFYFFFSFSGCWVIIKFCDFSWNKSCKTYLEPIANLWQKLVSDLPTYCVFSALKLPQMSTEAQYTSKTTLVLQTLLSLGGKESFVSTFYGMYQLFQLFYSFLRLYSHKLVPQLRILQHSPVEAIIICLFKWLSI